MNFLELKAGGKIRKVIFSTFLLLMFAVSTVYALPYWDGEVYMGSDGWTTPEGNVRTFDWAQSGSGMAIGITPGQPLNVGDTFTFTYQAFLVDLMNKDGDSSGTFTGLNDNYEYTFVANIEEEVVGFTGFLDPNGHWIQTAYFTPIGGDGYYYYDDNPNADVATGMGFDDGTQVLKAEISGGLSSFSYDTTTGIGGGGTAPYIDWILSPLWVDEGYIRPTTDPNLCDMHFGATLNYPPGNSETDDFFLSRAGEGNYATVGVTVDDMLFKVDGYTELTVPEPGTMLLLGSGLLGLAGFARRRKKKSGSLEA